MHSKNFEESNIANHFYRMCFLDTGQPAAWLEELPSPRVMTTHFPLKFLPEKLPKVNWLKINFIKKVNESK